MKEQNKFKFKAEIELVYDGDNYLDTKKLANKVSSESLKYIEDVLNNNLPYMSINFYKCNRKKEYWPTKVKAKVSHAKT